MGINLHNKRFWLLYTAGLILMGWLGWEASRMFVLDRLQQGQSTIAENLNQRLNFYQFAPQLLSDSSIVLQTLESPTSAALDALNKNLLALNQVLDSNVIYVMSQEGVTIAASNYAEADSFIGGDFSFRPYFKRAMQGYSNRYLALGATSGRRGYYFAAPVTRENVPLGVVVIKVSLLQLERNWMDRWQQFMISDEAGVVFFSSNPDWIYHRTSVSQQPLQVDTDHRYGEEAISPLFSQPLSPRETGLQQRKATTGGRWLLFSQRLPQWDLTVSTLLPYRLIYATTLLSLALYSLIAFSLGLLFLYRRKRRQLADVLRDHNSELNQRVDALTSELQNRNRELMLTLEQQQQDHQALKLAQAELVQAAKLATLGEFSAGLHHELAQPLQALISYAENGQKILAKKRYDLLGSNLDDILAVARAMTRIAEQFKVFARRAAPEPRASTLSEILSATQTIIQPRVEKQGVTLRVECDDSDVYCEPVLIEQVLVNLISNAIHALRDIKEPLVILRSREDGDLLWLSVIDNGAVIEAGILERFFQPFFTTRDSGMGLGLAITRRIVESQGGEIKASANPTGGVTFTFSIPRVKASLAIL